MEDLSDLTVAQRSALSVRRTIEEQKIFTGISSAALVAEFRHANNLRNSDLLRANELESALFVICDFKTP